MRNRVHHDFLLDFEIVIVAHTKIEGAGRVSRDFQLFVRNKCTGGLWVRDTNVCTAVWKGFFDFCISSVCVCWSGYVIRFGPSLCGLCVIFGVENVVIKLLRDLVLVSSLCMICVIEREMTVGSFPINWRCLFYLPWEEFLLYFIMSNVCSFASVVDILCGCDRALNSGHGFMEFSVKTRAWFIF